MRGADGATVRPINELDRSTFEYGLSGFQDEGRTLVRFRHPNIVPVLKFFDANGTAYADLALTQFAFCAFPADYGRSAVRTFIVNQAGVVYAMDLGSGERVMQWPAVDPNSEGWVKLD